MEDDIVVAVMGDGELGAWMSWWEMKGKWVVG